MPVASHQVQYSGLDRRPAAAMVPACEAHGIQLLRYDSLAGVLSERWIGMPEPPSPHEENQSLTKYHLIIQEFGGWALFQDPLRVLDGVARKHGVGLGSVAIRHVLDHPQVAAAIVGATSARHLTATVQAASLVMGIDDRLAIDAVAAGSWTVWRRQRTRAREGRTARPHHEVRAEQGVGRSVRTSRRWGRP